jgi:hypothetical protein
MASEIKKIGDSIVAHINSGGPWVVQFEPAYYRYPFVLAAEVEEKVRVAVSPISVSHVIEVRSKQATLQYSMGVIVFSKINTQVDRDEAVDKMIELTEQILLRIHERHAVGFADRPVRNFGLGLERPVSDTELINRDVFVAPIQINF